MNKEERTPRSKRKADSSKQKAAGALAVLRRGLRESPDLRAGLGYTVALGIAMTAGRVVVPVLVQQALQRGLVAAYRRVRTRVGETLSAVSESVMGADVVRAYGLQARTNRRVKEAVQRRYEAEMDGARYSATIFPMADLFGAA